MNEQRLLGAVLCGGRSTRMGRDKAALKLPDGRTFLQQAVSNLAAVSDEVCLFGQQPYESSCRFLPDDESEHGPMGGLVTALRLARAESFAAAIVIAVDTPLLRVTDLNQLIEAWRDSPHNPVCGRSNADGRLQPLIAIYPAACCDSLAWAVKTDRRSLLRWLEHHDHRAVTLPAHACQNLNTPQDLNQYLPPSPSSISSTIPKS